jgi:hypothetical protein
MRHQRLQGALQSQLRWLRQAVSLETQDCHYIKSSNWGLLISGINAGPG